MKKDIEYFFLRILNPFRTFRFNGRRYRYFYHRYNSTWRNERAVELPIVLSVLKEHAGGKILEVGNVLSHYIKDTSGRTIVDRYEKAPGIVNQDIVDFRPDFKYDLVVSISTLEHVGWDETPRDSGKIIKAMDNMKQRLAPGGEIIVTLPAGYNPEMDKLIFEDKIEFADKYYLKRISRDNRWKQVQKEELKAVEYNRPFPNANGIVIGMIKKI